MDTSAVLSPDETAELLRSCWYSHDAQWFLAVAQEFGMEAANRANRRAVRALGRTEVRRLGRAAGIENPNTVEDVARLIELGRGLLFPQPGMDIELNVIDEKSYEVAFRRCFVHEKVLRAGIGAAYDCAVFDRLYGWHDTLGMPLEGEPPAARCARYEGRECRRVLKIA